MFKCIKFIYVIIFIQFNVTMRRTTLAVSPETKAKLERLGRKKESYDDIIRRLLSISEEELELIDEVYERIERTPRKEYIRLEEV